MTLNVALAVALEPVAVTVPFPSAAVAGIMITLDTAPTRLDSTVKTR